MLLLGAFVFIGTSYVACGSADSHTFGKGRPPHSGSGGDASTGAGGTSGTGGGSAGGASGRGGTGGTGGGQGSGGRTKDSSADAPDDGPISNTG